MLEELKRISDIAIVAQSAAEYGALDVETYASVFESIVMSLNFLIAAMETGRGDMV